MNNLDKAIKEKTKDGRITCKEAFAIAAELGIKPAVVARRLTKKR